MPNQVIPIQDIAKVGVIMDTPSVSLPPNVFSDALNVRFDDNAIRKMEGEQSLFSNVGFSDLIYVAWWPHPDLSPTDGYYIIVARDDTNDRIYIVQASTTNNLDTDVSIYLKHTTPIGGDWQHTLFGGGRTLIMNNGISTPVYITDVSGNFFDLPGWDSYLVDETITTFVWNFNNVPDDGDTPLGVNVDFTDVPGGGTVQRVIVTVVPADPNIAQFSVVLDTATAQVQGVGIGFDTETDSHFLTFIERIVDSSGNVTQQGVANGDTVNIQIQTTPEIRVRARVVRTFGNLLIAGNLTEVMRDDETQMVRNMPGLIRTSDVAAAGNIPANWNPFHTGVNTADEFTLSSTGIVQDMAELQGVMYVYTNNSIHSIQATGNVSLPFNVRPVAEGYGAQTINAVREFDGKHVVIGSNDIYVFAGHPGSINSLADGRVRKYLFNNLNPTFEQNLHTILNRRWDELWINFPNRSSASGRCNETLIWNYRDNTWVRRAITPFFYSDVAPINEGGTLDPNIRVPIFVDGDVVFQGDVPGRYIDDDGNGYGSYVERSRLAITPEFDTETLASVALLTGGAATLDVSIRGSNTPGDENGVAGGIDFDFDISTDYKVDNRIHGRFLNFRIGEEGTAFWELSGMQYDIMKGGTR